MRNSVLSALILTCCAGAASAAAFDHSHAAWDAVLKARVAEGLVDYAGLKEDRAGLDGYLNALAGVERSTFDSWPEGERLAFLINAYNAYTLQLIIDHYPVKSIKDIGGFISGPWDQEVVSLFGDTLTLNDVEHGMIREDYDEPRIHVALVCAALGCPTLRSEAFVAERLDAQLDEQMRGFMGTAVKNRYDAGKRTLRLSRIFQWYGKDFADSGEGVAAYVWPYLPGNPGARPAKVRIKYTDYSWDLNKQE